MSESEIPAVIAEQEEYDKRRRPCEGVRFWEHRYETFRPSGSTGSIPADKMWRQCMTCGVTETPEDYRKKLQNETGEGTR